MELATDRRFVQIVDAAMAEAERRSGAWLACRPGCTQCCIGVFPITQLDALRLRHGLSELESRDPERAANVRRRAREQRDRFAQDFPGDARAGVLDATEDHPFWDLTDREPCPALDPATGRCDLYAARPITCRIFGPPARFGADSVAVCELCFDGATDEEIAACEVEIDSGDLEPALLSELEEKTGARGETIVAFALLDAWPTTTKSDS